MKMGRIVVRWGWVMVLVVVSGCARPGDTTEGGDEVPGKAEDVRPVLMGAALPKIVLKTAAGEDFDLNAAVAEKPTVLMFYRGGWCPYCNTQLGQLQAIEAKLVEMGFGIIGVSPDRPAKLNGSAAKNALTYQLLSDSEMTAAKAMGIAFRVDDETVNKYKTSYGIDLEADSGQTHHLLPVPSVFVVGTDGIIAFSYVNPNYKVRIDPAVLLEAAGAVKRGAVKGK